MRDLTPVEFKALARAGPRRGPIERITGLVGLDGRYRLLRGDPLERARSDARGAFRRQRRRPPDLVRALQRGLLAIGAAWIVAMSATGVVLVALSGAILDTDEQRESLAQLVAGLIYGAGFLAAAVMAELVRRRSLATLANPLGPAILRFARAGFLLVAMWCWLGVGLFLASGALAGHVGDALGDRTLEKAAVLIFGALGLIVLAWLWRMRPWPPQALRPLRDVELAVATAAIDPSVDTRLLRAAWDSVTGSRR